MSAGIEYANEAYVWIGQTQITTKLEGEVSLINCSSLVLYYLQLFPFLPLSWYFKGSVHYHSCFVHYTSTEFLNSWVRTEWNIKWADGPSLYSSVAICKGEVAGVAKHTPRFLNLRYKSFEN